MHAYIINLDKSIDRWANVASKFADTKVSFERVSAINGRELTYPIPECDERLYRRAYGRQLDPGVIGCYLSHLKCCRLFLESRDEFAIIAEDDAVPVTNLAEICEAALKFKDTWDIIRLSGWHNPIRLGVRQLLDEYSLTVCFQFLAGTGAYLLSRPAAQRMVDSMLPICEPIDHAIDKEWKFGLRSLCIYPLPVSQLQPQFASTIVVGANFKLPWFKSYWTVMPYRMQQEAKRLVRRSGQVAYWTLKQSA